MKGTNFMKLKRSGILLLLVFCLGLSSCSTASYLNEDQGWILMRYTTNQDKGISGVEPVDLGEDVLLVQEVFPGTLEELKIETQKSISSGELPAPAGTFLGSGLTWELYTGETEIPDIGPFTVAVLLGIAADDKASYFVGLVTLPDSYEEHADKFQSVFYHTLYAYSPIE
jgi:hypothetical protein